MPSRIVREGIISSARVNALSMGAENFYRRLMSVVDDFGRYHGSVVTLRGACWPTNPERIREKDLSKWLNELLRGDAPLVKTYIVGGATYLEIQEFGQQTRTKSRFPDPPWWKSDINLPADRQQDAGKVPEIDGTSRSRMRSRNSETNTDAAPARLREMPTPAQPSPKFEQWWTLWSSVRGSNHRFNAEQVYPREVTEDLEQDCLECTRSYLESLDNPAKGYNPENFLIDQRRDKYKSRWPPRSPTKPQRVSVPNPTKYFDSRTITG